MTRAEPRPELTVAEKRALGKLLAAYRSAKDWLVLAPSDPTRALLDRLVGTWVERSEDGARYRITNWGVNAFYRGRVVRESYR